VVGRAEGVGDAVLASVAHQQDPGVRQLLAALSALGQRSVDAARLTVPARLPARSLHHPRDDVLEAAERGAALGNRLAGAPAVTRLDRHPAPAAIRIAQ
jgi:hypothetical protein